MTDLYRKMIDEAMMAQRADVGMVKKKRGQNFVIEDARAYLDAVRSILQGHSGLTSPTGCSEGLSCGCTSQFI